MAFESLTDRLAGVFKKLRGHGKLTEADIKAAMREVRMALLEADVNYKVAKDFCAKVSERAMGQEVMESLTPAQQVVKIVNEELVAADGRQRTPGSPVPQEQGPDRHHAGAACRAPVKPPTPQSWQGTVCNTVGTPPHAGGLRYLPSCGHQPAAGGGQTGWASPVFDDAGQAKPPEHCQGGAWHTPRITAMTW